MKTYKTKPEFGELHAQGRFRVNLGYYTPTQQLYIINACDVRDKSHVNPAQEIFLSLLDKTFFVHPKLRVQIAEKHEYCIQS